MLNQFNHVIDERLRSILTNEDTDEDSVCYALNVTQAALKDDMGNEDVDYTVLDTRIQAHDEAHDWWNDEGRGDKAINALKNCWLV